MTRFTDCSVVGERAQGAFADDRIFVDCKQEEDQGFCDSSSDCELNHDNSKSDNSSLGNDFKQGLDPPYDIPQKKIVCFNQHCKDEKCHRNFATDQLFFSSKIYLPPMNFSDTYQREQYSSENTFPDSKSSSNKSRVSANEKTEHLKHRTNSDFHGVPCILDIGNDTQVHARILMSQPKSKNLKKTQQNDDNSSISEISSSECSLCNGMMSSKTTKDIKFDPNNISKKVSSSKWNRSKSLSSLGNRKKFQRSFSETSIFQEDCEKCIAQLHERNETSYDEYFFRPSYSLRKSFYSREYADAHHTSSKPVKSAVKAMDRRISKFQEREGQYRIDSGPPFQRSERRIQFRDSGILKRSSKILFFEAPSLCT